MSSDVGLERFHPLDGAKEVGHGVVHARYDLVDGLLPRRVHVLGLLDGAEELAQRRLDHVAKASGNLFQKKKSSQLK